MAGRISRFDWHEQAPSRPRYRANAGRSGLIGVSANLIFFTLVPLDSLLDPGSRIINIPHPRSPLSFSGKRANTRAILGHNALDCKP
jgi:hypothetical protein